MFSSYSKNRILLSIFNQGAFGNTLYAVLHKQWPTRTGNPTSFVADYTSYAAVPLVANDASQFTVVANAVRLAAPIDFPENTGSSQYLEWVSICTGTTGADTILAMMPLGSEALRTADFSVQNTGGGISVINYATHGYAVNDQIRVNLWPDARQYGSGGGATPEGNYYISSTGFTANAFMLATGLNGSGTLNNVGTTAALYEIQFQKYTPITLLGSQSLRLPAYSVLARDFFTLL